MIGETLVNVCVSRNRPCIIYTFVTWPVNVYLSRNPLLNSRPLLYRNNSKENAFLHVYHMSGECLRV